MKFFSLKNLLSSVIPLLCFSACLSAFSGGQSVQLALIEKQLAAMEASSGIKIGVFAMNTANNASVQYRAEERFPFQSTFKVLLASAILKKSEGDPNLLRQVITYKKSDLVFWSPSTERHLAEGMSVFDLCAASVMYTDNTAANLLMKKLGGLKAVNSFAHSIGDHAFRINHWEPHLNSNPSNIDDTSTPKTMGKSLQKLIFGNVLADPHRKQLINWMKDSTTGYKRIRAGVPKGWVVADKTGSGKDYGVANDIGILWPPQGAPIIVVIYSVNKQKDAAFRDEAIASVTRLLINEFFNYKFSLLYRQ